MRYSETIHLDVLRPNRALGSSPSYGSLERQADHASGELRNVNPTPPNGAIDRAPSA